MDSLAGGNEHKFLLSSFILVDSFLAASLQWGGITAMFMAQICSPVPARKLKKILPHHIIEPSSLLSCRCCCVLMCPHAAVGLESHREHDNDERLLQMSVHTDGNMNWINADFPSFWVAHGWTKGSLFSQTWQSSRWCRLRLFFFFF